MQGGPDRCWQIFWKLLNFGMGKIYLKTWIISNIIFQRRKLTYPGFRANLKEVFHFRSSLKYFQRGTEQCIPVPPSPLYECLILYIGIGMEGGRGGRGVLDYLPDCSEDHSACWGGMGFGHKNGDMEGGLVISSLFFNSYFAYSIFGAYPNCIQGGFFFFVFKKCRFNLGFSPRFTQIYVFFFSRIRK